MRLPAFLANLPVPVRWAILAIVAVFVLAIVVGLFNRPSATPAGVSVVAPAASPSQLAAAAPAAPPAAPAAAPPTPQLGGGAPAVSAVVMRAAKAVPAGTALADCVRETLALPADANEYNLDNAKFIAAATRDECATPTLSLSPVLHADFAAYVPERARGNIELTRAGLYQAPTAGEYVVALVGDSATQSRCALFAGDLSVPVLQGGDYHGRFTAAATLGLDAGAHELALVCSFGLRKEAGGGVTVSIRAPGEAAPRLVALQSPSAPTTPVAAGGK